ncbi:hypothetical protein [Paracoccus sp. JM45]|nr:hypothetical protein [Paracoccus sp. JM45]
MPLLIIGYIINALQKPKVENSIVHHWTEDVVGQAVNADINALLPPQLQK